MKQIAIVGAGLSGLTLAHFLTDKANVTLFEKSRGVSGRMSTRYADPYQFDHGAQYLTARTDEFKAFLQPFVRSGTLQVWNPTIVTLKRDHSPVSKEWSEPRYVPAPRMNAWCQALAEPLCVHLKTHVSRLEQNGTQWEIVTQDDHRFGPFDWVVSSAPAPQASNLLPEPFVHHEQMKRVKMTGCYTLMLGYKHPLSLEWDAAAVEDSLVGWMAVNANKPDRQTGYSLVVQSTNAWAEQHLEMERDEIQRLMLHEVAHLTGVEVSHAENITVHRWLYASTETPAETPYLLDEQNHLAACGDWCIGGKVEAAFTSGYTLAQALEQYL